MAVNELDFPTDHYAVRAQMRQRGIDPDERHVVIESRDGRTIEEDDVIDALSEDTAILFMPSVLYGAASWSMWNDSLERPAHTTRWPDSTSRTRWRSCHTTSRSGASISPSGVATSA